MMMLYVVFALLAALAAALLVAVLRTLALPRKQTEYVPSADETRMGEYAKKLSRMVQAETISDRADPAVEKFISEAVDKALGKRRHDPREPDRLRELAAKMILERTNNK